ncbi:hypothetical protein B0H17DRAFT_1098856 [Mycena rosella]|uniref:Uncharacterized protein n=1 Tax=Mycena rosella TaxID=1033263 RepID=A0AAD7G3K1_MYCRO|nr:hypothetical protein B0H17DRAFT_1098856 [Mycena rosella]
MLLDFRPHYSPPSQQFIRGSMSFVQSCFQAAASWIMFSLSIHQLRTASMLMPPATRKTFQEMHQAFGLCCPFAAVVHCLLSLSVSAGPHIHYPHQYVPSFCNVSSD